MQSKIIKMIIAYRETSATKVAEQIGKSQANFTQMLARDNFRESDLRSIAAALDCELLIKWKDKKTGKEF